MMYVILVYIDNKFVIFVILKFWKSQPSFHKCKILHVYTIYSKKKSLTS